MAVSPAWEPETAREPPSAAQFAYPRERDSACLARGTSRLYRLAVTMYDASAMTESPAIPPRELPRKLGLVTGMAVVVGVIIGSGIFRVPSPHRGGSRQSHRRSPWCGSSGASSRSSARFRSPSSPRCIRGRRPLRVFARSVRPPARVPVWLDVAADRADLVGCAEPDVRGIPGVFRADSAPPRSMR